MEREAGTNPRATPKGKLLRVLGIGFGVAVTVGSVIGVGILRAPGQVAEQLPNAWLFIGVWIIGGLYALLCAPSWAELGTMIPRSGGLYVFAQRALGNYAGFIVGWTDWLSYSGTITVLAILFGELIGRLFPAFKGWGQWISFTIVVVFPILQWQGIRRGSHIQNVTTLIKAFAFVGLGVGALILGSHHPAVGSQAQPIPAGLPLFAAIILALQGVIFTYDSYYAAVYYSEEVRNPERNIPRSIFIGILLVTGIYLIINIALLCVLPLSQIAGNEFVWGNLAQAVFGSGGDAFITVLTIISVLNAINSNYLSAPRVLYTMSRDGLFSGQAVRVNEGGTPTVALLMTSVASVIFLLSGTFEKVLAVLTFFVVFNYGASFLALFVMRWREPNIKRPYRAWGYPWTTGLAASSSLAFLVGAVIGDTRNSIYALVCLVFSYPIFVLTMWLYKRRPQYE